MLPAPHRGILHLPRVVGSPHLCGPFSWFREPVVGIVSVMLFFVAEVCFRFLLIGFRKMRNIFFLVKVNEYCPTFPHIFSFLFYEPETVNLTNFLVASKTSRVANLFKIMFRKWFTTLSGLPVFPPYPLPPTSSQSCLETRRILLPFLNWMSSFSAVVCRPHPLVRC